MDRPSTNKSDANTRPRTQRYYSDSADWIFSKLDQNINSLYEAREPDNADNNTWNLERAIVDQEEQILGIQFFLRCRPRSQSQDKIPRHRYNRGYQADTNVCWFHQEFGNKAKNYKPRCKYQVDQEN